MNDNTLNDLSNIISGKSSVQVEVPVLNIVYISIGILVAVFLGIILANQVTKN